MVHNKGTTTKTQGTTHEKTTAGVGNAKTHETKYSGTRARHKARGFRIQVYAGTGSSDAKRQAKSDVSRGAEELLALCKVAEAVDGDQASHHFDEHELVAGDKWDARDEDEYRMYHEGGARIHEDAYKDGRHGKGYEVDRKEVEAEHQTTDDAEEGDDTEEEADALETREEVASGTGL